ncbi:hypothetical protein [Mariniluteicoccus flavus]
MRSRAPQAPPGLIERAIRHASDALTARLVRSPHDTHRPTRPAVGSDAGPAGGRRLHRHGREDPRPARTHPRPTPLGRARHADDDSETATLREAVGDQVGLLLIDGESLFVRDVRGTAHRLRGGAVERLTDNAVMVPYGSRTPFDLGAFPLPELRRRLRAEPGRQAMVRTVTVEGPALQFGTGLASLDLSNEVVADVQETWLTGWRSFAPHGLDSPAGLTSGLAELARASGPTINGFAFDLRQLVVNEKFDIVMSMDAISGVRWIEAESLPLHTAPAEGSGGESFPSHLVTGAALMRITFEVLHKHPLARYFSARGTMTRGTFGYQLTAETPLGRLVGEADADGKVTSLR